MTKTRSTKKALLLSAFSLLICFSMLIGTTFAWFTDSVTSANNIIKSGNLDVELYYQVEGQSDWTKVTATTNVFKNGALWEPGHTEVVKLKVVNEGSLALKYQLGVNIASEVGSVNVNNEAFKLSDYIYYGIVDGAQTYTRDQAIAAVDATATALKTAYKSIVDTSLDAKNDTDSDEKIVTMVVYMPTTVGNEANAKTGEAVPTINLGINLFATQYTSESDSFGPYYDKNATYPASKTETAEGGKTITAGEVAIKLPTGAANADYTVKVDNKVVNTTATGDTTVSFNIELLKDGVKVESATGVSYPVSIYVGKNLNITDVKHKGVSVADFDYDSTTGDVSFETDSFSPFEVIYYSGEVTAKNFEDLLARGGKFTLTENLTLDETLEIPTGVEVVLDLNDKTITGAGLNADGKKVHTIVNYGTLTIADGTVASSGTNGGSAVYNYGILTLNNVIVKGAPSNTAAGTASYAVNNTGEKTVLTVNDSNVTGRGAIGVTGGAKAIINSGEYHTPAVAWGHAVYADGEKTEVIINGGTFSEGWEYAADRWGMYQIYASNKAVVTVNGGDFSKQWDCANGYDLCTASGGSIVINGGTFADNPSKQNNINYVAADSVVLKNADSTFTVYAASSSIELADGAVLDLDGVEFNGTVVAKGDLTIKGDTKIKTLKSTAGGTITIEDGKTLTLNNFSFGSKDTAGAEYEIKGGRIIAAYGFFQHGTYKLKSDFETGYMYYSFGSDITVYGTFHSQGKGDGLDYVRGKLTIAAGGKSIHDKSLWVGQPASWGAMNATLIIEEGGYVQANSISVYDGSVAYNSSANVGKDGVGVKYNSLTGTIDSIQ